MAADKAWVEYKARETYKEILGLKGVENIEVERIGDIVLNYAGMANIPLAEEHRAKRDKSVAVGVA